MSSTTLECIEIETQEKPEYAIIWLHGLGADGNDFVPVIPELQPDQLPAIRFLFPHAPTRPVTVNNGMRMRAWYDIFTTDLVRREDEGGIRESESAIRSLIARENIRGIPTQNIILAGFSQGCAMTLHTGLRLDEPLAGMIALSGYLPLQDKFPTERKSANDNTPIFMGHGNMDPVVAISRGEASYEILKNLDYPIQWHQYPMPHSVCAEEIQDIAQFLRNVLVTK